MKKSDLVRINASTFYEGMQIEGEVFFKYDRSYILLCKDVTITNELLKKLYQTEWGDKELFVSKEHVGDILEMSKQYKKSCADRGEEVPEMKRTDEDMESVTDMIELAAKINLYNDYTNIRERLGDFMDVVKNEKKVPPGYIEPLQEEISRKIELTDPALLIECINNLRQPDDYLNAHAANVAMLNGMMGTWMKLSQEEIDALIRTGLVHDIGKLSIADEILNKPGPLTKAEFEEMKKHPVFSYEMLKLSGETDERILEGSLSHHERLNGTGYPQGSHYSDISLFSRVTAVSDVYDAMVAKRSYKDRRSPFAILEEFAVHKFSNLDIGIVNTLLDNLPAALVGKNALLSDGRAAKVIYINPQNFEYPVVEHDKKLIFTTHELECVAMENFLISVDE